MATGSQGTWIFSSNYEIEQIGQSIAGNSGGNDIIAFLPDVAASVCKKINAELGIGGTDGDADGVPTAGANILPVYATDSMTEFNPNNPGIAGSETVIAGSFIGQPFGCFDANDGDNTSEYVYYHVLVER